MMSLFIFTHVYKNLLEVLSTCLLPYLSSVRVCISSVCSRLIIQFLPNRVVALGLKLLHILVMRRDLEDHHNGHSTPREN